MHQILFRLGLCPSGKLAALPGSLSWIYGHSSKVREGRKGKGGRGEREERERNGGKSIKGKGMEGRGNERMKCIVPPPTLSNLTTGMCV